MVLLTHIIIALAGLVAASAAYARPSLSKLRVSYALVVATFATGTYLVVLSPSHLAGACVSGLVYLGAVSVAIIAARHKLAGQQ